MEINKVLFTDSVNLNSIGTSTNTEKAASDSQSVSYTDEIDETSEIVQSESKKSKKKKETQETTSSASKQGLSCYEHVNESEAKDKIKNSKGTVYLVMGNLPYCGACDMLEKDLKKNKSELDSVATCYNINWKENSDYCWSLYKKLNKNAEGVSFPVVIEFVDGEPVASFYGGTGTAHTKAVKRMISDAKANNKAEDAKNNTDNTNNDANDVNNNVEDCPECQIKADDEAQNEGNAQDTEELVAKKKLETMKENLQIMNNFVQEITTDALEDAIENASSISGLKDVVNNYSTGLDFNLQLNLQSTVNSMNEDTDLKKAKATLLGML